MKRSANGITGPRTRPEQRMRVKKLRLGATERKVMDHVCAKASFWSHGFVTMETANIVKETGCLDGAVRRAMRSLRRRGVLVYADRRAAPVGKTRTPIWAGPYLRAAELGDLPDRVLVHPGPRRRVPVRKCAGNSQVCR